VNNALIHSCLHYAVLIYVRATKTVIQPFVNLKNKVLKFLCTSNKNILDGMCIQNQSLTINKYLKCLLVRLCTLIKTIYSHHILSSTSQTI